MKIRSIASACIAATLFSWSFAGHHESGEEPEFKPLFNGKNLDGWYVIDREGVVEGDSVFTVTKSQLHVYKNMEEGSEQTFAGIITEEEFTHYHLKLEYKWGETKHAPRDKAVRDAGIIIHTFEPFKVWPSGIECQIQEGDTGDLWVIGAKASSKVQNVIRNYHPKGTLQTRGHEGKRFARFHRGYMWEVPGWNLVELIVDGDHAVFKVNGHVVNEAIDMSRWDENQQQWLPLVRGPILLQAEGAEIFYRNIEIKVWE